MQTGKLLKGGVLAIVARGGANMTHVKRQNRASILRLIDGEGGLSRKDIARRLRLSPAAITVITNEMINEGLLEETGGKNIIRAVRAGAKLSLIFATENIMPLASISILITQ